MTLTRKHIAQYSPVRRSSKDRRRFVAWAVFSYRDQNGHEYRKAFELPQNTPMDEFYLVAPNTITT